MKHAHMQAAEPLGQMHRGAAARLAAFIQLTKPRITAMLLVTCIAAMLCAEQGIPSLTVAFATSLGLALTGGGASALNHLLDRDIDALMERTRMRPVVTGLVTPREAAVFGSALLVAGTLLLGAFVNTLTALLALAGGSYYVFVYTGLLKRTTTLNIVIGGVAGAMPPLVGWAAATGGLSPLAWMLFGIVAIWTPPHFWALAMLMREDYTRARVPMLPAVVGDASTARQVWWYTVALAAFTVVPVAGGELGAGWLVVAVALDAWLLSRAYRLLHEVRRAHDPAHAVATSGAARRAALGMFLASLTWLGLMFAAAAIDRLAQAGGL